jgi:hypothetical protein
VTPPNAAAQRDLFPGKELRRSFTVPEYKRWLTQFKTDNEDRIDRKKLREAISRRGVSCFSGLHAGTYGNDNGFVDDSSKIEGLILFTQRELGFRITTDAGVRPSTLRALA